MKIAITILTAVLLWIAASWAEMLLFGILHDHWWSLMPSMGFKVALIITGIVFLARFAGAAVGAFIKAVYE